MGWFLVPWLEKYKWEEPHKTIQKNRGYDVSESLRLA